MQACMLQLEAVAQRLHEDMQATREEMCQLLSPASLPSHRSLVGKMDVLFALYHGANCSVSRRYPSMYSERWTPQLHSRVCQYALATPLLT